MTKVSKPRVVFVDDEADLASSLAAKYADHYSTTAFDSPFEALRCIDETVAVVVADHRMPGMTGVELLTKLRTKSPETVRILLTAVADLIRVSDLVNEAKVFHYIPKAPLFPEEMGDVLADAVDLHALRQQRKRHLADLEQQNTQLKAQLRVKTSDDRCFNDLIGEDLKFQEALGLAKWAATNDLPVLITGETGTGKDELARAIHFESKRNSRPFGLINCSLFRAEHAQSALFGNVKGAFTDAAGATGILRATEGGTIFLDEVGELSLEVQAFLLSFLDHGLIHPIGYSGPSIKGNVRVITATNRTLECEIEKKSFRLDLFHRINGTAIHLPPLRERRKDIPALARNAVMAGAAKLGLLNVVINGSALELLQSLPYPGNIRELNHTIERAMGFMQRRGDSALTVEHIRASTAKPTRESVKQGSLEEAVDDFSKTFIEAVLRRHGYKQVQAAKELGISDRYLRDLIKKFGILKEM